MADDLGVLYTDKELRDIEKKISKLYAQAEKDIEAKLADFTEKAERKERIYIQKVKAGEMTQEEFDHWKAGVVFRGKQWENKMTQVSNVLADTNATATNILRSREIGAFTMNGNYAAYDIEHGFGVDFGFDLYDEKTVARLIADDPNILPFKKLDKKKDVRWNFKNIRSQITQGILQGESIPKIAERLAQVVPNRNKKQMVLHARTAMTAAQNAGRQERYKEAEDLGIKFKKVWLATLDARTRDAHADLDGQAVKPDKPFKIDGYEIEYPGDPHAAPEMVYNCRCTMVTELDDYPSSFTRRETSTGRVIGNMNYRDWEKWKSAGGETKPEPKHVIIQGKDITDTWQRRADKFDFEIEDVINAQGFDGLPRVVSAEEFDKAVKESNFIAQRTYSAPDQETLDAYRNQLYNGKWYVDCSTGGAQYGQGMYCAADYTGTLSEGIQKEMQHYAELGRKRYQEPAKMIARFNGISPEEYIQKYGIGNNYVETLTLDPSANIVTYSDLFSEFNSWKMDAGARAQRSIIESYSNKGQDFVTVLKYESVDGGVKFSDVKKAYENLSQSDKDLTDKIITEMNEAWRKADIDVANMNIGSYAAMRGYDAINAEGHGESGSYTVVLNRTKVIFKGE